MTTKSIPVDVCDCIRRLEALPELIAQAERDCLAAEEHKYRAAEALVRAEDELLLDPEKLTGRNSEVRAAQVRAGTELERDILRASEFRVGEARIALRRLTNELSTLKTISRLIGGAE